jgi:putative ABC transport system ATP-binding protein
VVRLRDGLVHHNYTNEKRTPVSEPEW